MCSLYNVLEIFRHERLDGRSTTQREYELGACE